MSNLDDTILVTKKMLTKHGRLAPKLPTEGSAGSEVVPLPDLPEAIKLSVLKGLGHTLAVEDRVGALAQVVLVAEGWRGRSNGPHAALRPQHDSDRVESVMVVRYQVDPVVRQMVVYDFVRDPAREPIELTPIEQPGPGESAAESPPLEAIVRGFARGRAGQRDEPSAS